MSSEQRSTKKKKKGKVKTLADKAAKTPLDSLQKALEDAAIEDADDAVNHRLRILPKAFLINQRILFLRLGSRCARVWKHSLPR